MYRYRKIKGEILVDTTGIIREGNVNMASPERAFLDTLYLDSNNTLMINLPRFSTDLDFNLLDPQKEQEVYDRVRRVVLKYGKIHDEAIKHFGIIIVLDYGIGERKLKIEISNRPLATARISAAEPGRDRR